MTARIVADADQLLFDQLATSPGDVLLVSPYVSYKVAQHIADLAAKAPGPWTLITCADPAAANAGYLNISGLRALLKAGVTLAHVDRLHAKVFLAGDCFGLVGSANLTEAGLGSAAHPNAELGVALTADEVTAIRSIIASWSRTPLHGSDLDQLEEAALQLAKPARVPKPSTRATVSAVDRLIADARTGERALWVKAEYGRRTPESYAGEWFFASPGPRRRPGFAAGDLVLMYAQRDHVCYAVVEVTDEPTFDPAFLRTQGFSDEDAERWPWVSRTIPRLVPDAKVDVLTEGIGVSAQSLRTGAVHVSLAGFSSAVRQLEAESSRVVPTE